MTRLKNQHVHDLRKLASSSMGSHHDYNSDYYLIMTVCSTGIFILMRTIAKEKINDPGWDW